MYSSLLKKVGDPFGIIGKDIGLGEVFQKEESVWGPSDIRLFRVPIRLPENKKHMGWQMSLLPFCTQISFLRPKAIPEWNNFKEHIYTNAAICLESVFYFFSSFSIRSSKMHWPKWLLNIIFLLIMHERNTICLVSQVQYAGVSMKQNL